MTKLGYHRDRHTLGAPFWFDLLNRLVSLRTSLPPKEDECGGCLGDT